MTEKNAGLLIFFDEERRGELIRDKIEGHSMPFTDALSVSDWKVGEINIALLSFSATTIDYISLARRGDQVVTGKRRIHFSDFIPLKSISLKSIEARLKGPLVKHFLKASQGGGRTVPSVTWNDVIAAIKSERPGLISEIDRILALQNYSGLLLKGKTAELLLQERDALGTSLDIFSGNNKLRDQILGQWAPPAGTLEEINEKERTAVLGNPGQARSSFLKGISQRGFQEESAIQHDLFNWPGMSPNHGAGFTEFKAGNRRLEVYYANRNDLEKTLGVDLIYFNERFKLFVLVQYKLMRKEGNRFLYRPDEQLKKELERMNHFYQLCRSAGQIKSERDYRLNDDGFMLKFVPNKGLQPATGELIGGMYIPREYMNFLIGPDGPKGPRGGAQIAFDAGHRHLNNSEFTENVHKGWIGSSGVHSEMIEAMIKEYYESEKELMFARETDL